MSNSRRVTTTTTSSSSTGNQEIAETFEPRTEGSNLRWLKSLSENGKLSNNYRIVQPHHEEPSKRKLTKVIRDEEALEYVAQAEILICDVTDEYYIDRVVSHVHAWKASLVGLQGISTYVMSDILTKLDFTRVKKIAVRNISDEAMDLLYYKILLIAYTRNIQMTVICHETGISDHWQGAFNNLNILQNQDHQLQINFYQKMRNHNYYDHVVAIEKVLQTSLCPTVKAIDGLMQTNYCTLLDRLLGTISQKAAMERQLAIHQLQMNQAKAMEKLRDQLDSAKSNLADKKEKLEKLEAQNLELKKLKTKKAEKPLDNSVPATALSHGEISFSVNIKASGMVSQDEVAGLKNEITRLNSELARLNTENLGLRKVTSEQTASFARFHEEFKKYDTKKQAEIAALQDYVRSAKQEAQNAWASVTNRTAKPSIEPEVQQFLSTNEDELTELKQKLVNEESHGRYLKGEITRITQELDAAKSAATQQAKDFSAQEAQLEELRKKITILQNTNNIADKAINDFREQKTSLEQLQAQLNSDLAKEKKKLLAVENDLHESTQANASLKEANKTFSQKNDDLSDENNDLSVTVDRLQSALDEQTKLAQEVDKKLNAALIDKTELEIALEAAERETVAITASQDKLVADNSDLTKKKSWLKRKLEKFEQGNYQGEEEDNSKSAVKKAKTEKDSIQAELDKVKVQNQNLLTQQRSIEEALAEQTSKLSEAQVTNFRLTTEKDTALNKVTRATGEVSRKREYFQKRINGLNAQIASLQTANEALVQDHKVEIDNYLIQANVKQEDTATKEELRAQIDLLRTDRDNAAKRHKSEMDNLKNQHEFELMARPSPHMTHSMFAVSPDISSMITSNANAMPALSLNPFK